MACIEVFALRGTSRLDDAAEYPASQVFAEESAPALVRLIALIAARFQLQASEKAAAQMVPIIGAAGGAVINLLFIDHFQDMSRGHFTVRRLERQYGSEAVRRAYERI